MKILFIILSICISILNCQSQNTLGCYTTQFSPEKFSFTKTTNDLKIVRVNFHFMQLSDGTGNFTEYTDGDGRYYTGYQYARDHVAIMNNICGQNQQLNLPIGNNLPIKAKNLKFVLDAVYFVPNSNSYLYGQQNYTLNGKDKQNVLNIFISHGTGSTFGAAYDLTTNPSNNKYTTLNAYWFNYKKSMNDYGNPNDWARSVTTSHELLHLLTLSHTVYEGGGNPCNNGCTVFNTFCPDDGCLDTPTATEVMQLNNCQGSPSCDWGVSGFYCSNNHMDYKGDFALSPCQIDRVHAALEGGLKQFLSCYAVNIDQTFCDLGYPKTSYFGKNVIVGNCGTLAHITNQEKIDMYFSSSVELNNFEVRADSEFEIILEPVCGF